MPYENIIVETRGKTGLITLDRPKALNALNDLEDGTFLVRDSSTLQGEYVLSVKFVSPTLLRA